MRYTDKDRIEYVDDGKQEKIPYRKLRRDPVTGFYYEVDRAVVHREGLEIMKQAMPDYEFDNGWSSRYIE
jgi:hypothetical protein